jgi:ubiquinone/menaquinone biosynthesis C-methylase UbiE
MIKNRGYQYNFSEMLHEQMYNVKGRERKAKTMIAVLSDFINSDLKSLSALDVGSSTGIIANYCSNYFCKVIGIDIDEAAVQFANDTHKKDNLKFIKSDSMAMDFQESEFDVAICAHVYEHVPDAQKLMQEIYRVLKPGGVCYFSAGNRLNINEAHYNLPFLSIIPRPLAHIYIRAAGKADFYYEKHLSYWGLKNLVRTFKVIDYTGNVIGNPDLFHAGYMIQKRSKKARLAKLIVNYAYFLCPTYIWLLQKPV